MSWHKEWQGTQDSIAEFSTICNEHVAALAVKSENIAVNPFSPSEAARRKKT